MLKNTPVSSSVRRTDAQIAADRALLKSTMKSASYRVNKSDRERVNYLLANHNGRAHDIAAVTRIALSNVKRWVMRPETRESAGRPSYLNPEDFDTL